MAILIILALLVSGIPAGDLSVRCAGCCDEARAVPDDAGGPPCCRLTPDAPQLVARPAPAGATAVMPAAPRHLLSLTWSSPRLNRVSDALPLAHPPPPVPRI